MNTELLKSSIEKLKTGFTGSDFIVYYSDGKTTMDKQSWDRNELFGQISSQNSSIAIYLPDEIENISVPLEKHLQKESYSDVYFHCFVGKSFFENDYQDILLARMLIVNSLIPPKYNVFLLYYPCGTTYDYEIIKFKSEYKSNLITKIIYLYE